MCSNLSCHLPLSSTTLLFDPCSCYIIIDADHLVVSCEINIYGNGLLNITDHSANSLFGCNLPVLIKECVTLRSLNRGDNGIKIMSTKISFLVSFIGLFICNLVKKSEKVYEKRDNDIK